MNKCNCLFPFPVDHPSRSPLCQCCLLRKLCLLRRHLPNCSTSANKSVRNKVANANGNSAQQPLTGYGHLRASTRSAHRQPNPCQLADELRECILDGNAVIGELQRFIQNGGDNLPKELPVDFEENGGQGEDREKLEQFVKLVKAQCQLGRRIEKIVPCLFEELCSCSAQLDDDDEHAQSEQVLSKGFAKLLGIVVRFDTMKGTTPALQNAFSLYRRISVLDKQHIGFHLLHAHQADQISLFLARPTPLLSSLVYGTERFIGRWQHSRDLAISHLTGTLLVIYNVLRHMVERNSRLRPSDQPPNSNPDPFLRSMVGLMLLFDHIDPSGLFSPQSPFDIVAFIELIVQNASSTEEKHLLAILRHFSKSFKGPNTTASVRAMFGNRMTFH